MGQTNSVFTEKEMDDFEALTVLNRREIISAFKMFRALDYESVSEDRTCELPMALIQSIPALRVNPFRERICNVFSYSGTGNMTFEDFLEMLSAFSDKSPMRAKLEYAFRIYDFDDDRIISRDDIKTTVLCLTQANELHGEDQLDEDQMEFLIDKVMEEADMDMETGICFEEFSTLMKQKPEFLEYFRLRI